jgi:predicted nucleotidyltransferase
MGSSKNAIMKTLLYSDIFDYPLLEKEIWKYLISFEKADYQQFQKSLYLKDRLFETRKNYYFLRGRKTLVNLREERKIASAKKIKFARQIIEKLAKVPSVRFIGISGALAMKNSGENDDIDLFVIASKKSLWITRMTIALFLKALGVYRGKNEKNISDKICLNMLLDETGLAFPRKRRDLYTAHEIVQIMPIFQKDNFYEKFINANSWIYDFLPNALMKKEDIENMKLSFLDRVFAEIFEFSPFDFIAKTFQIWYMKKRLTNETVLNNFIAFHPFNYKVFVLKKYSQKLSEFGLESTRGY